LNRPFPLDPPARQAVAVCPFVFSSAAAAHLRLGEPSLTSASKAHLLAFLSEPWKSFIKRLIALGAGSSDGRAGGMGFSFPDSTMRMIVAGSWRASYRV